MYSYLLSFNLFDWLFNVSFTVYLMITNLFNLQDILTLAQLWVATR